MLQTMVIVSDTVTTAINKFITVEDIIAWQNVIVMFEPFIIKITQEIYIAQYNWRMTIIQYVLKKT